MCRSWGCHCARLTRQLRAAVVSTDFSSRCAYNQAPGYTSDWNVLHIKVGNLATVGDSAEGDEQENGGDQNSAIVACALQPNQFTPDKLNECKLHLCTNAKWAPIVSINAGYLKSERVHETSCE